MSSSFRGCTLLDAAPGSFDGRYFSGRVFSARSRFASRPIPESDGFSDLSTFVSMLLSLLRTALDVFNVMPMVFDHFHDLFVGLRHDHSASLRNLT